MFRKLYKEANDEIKIDNQLIDNILTKSKVKKKKTLYKPVIYQIAAAVVLVIGCSTGISQLMKKPDLETKKIIPVHDSSPEYEASQSPYAEEKTADGVTEDEAMPTDAHITASPVITTSPAPQASQPGKSNNKSKTTEKPAETQNTASAPQEITETAQPARKKSEKKEVKIIETQPGQEQAQPETYADESTAEVAVANEKTATENIPAVASEESSEAIPEAESQYMMNSGYSYDAPQPKSGGGSSGGGGGSASALSNVMNKLTLPTGFSCTSSSSSYYKYSDNTGKSFSVYVNSKPSEAAVLTFEYNGSSYYVTAVNMTDDEIKQIFLNII